MDIIALIIGIAIGLTIGFLLAKRQKSSDVQTPSEDVSFFKTQIEKLEEAISNERTDNKTKIQELANATQEVNFLKEKLEENKKEIVGIKDSMTKEFKLIASGILDENTQKFTRQNKDNLDSILTPLKERIKEFEDKVDKNYRHRTSEQAILKTELKQLIELNQTLSQEAKNLTTALKGESKTQGNWGEMVLQRILENSGLSEGQEFELQYTTRDEHGQQLRPDVLIRLPEGKHIVVDSKVSLLAYERLVNSDDPDERERSLRDHLVSIKTHIRDLSEKNYQAGKGIKSPDFVLLFMPIESSFGIAMNEDKDLFSFAWDRKVVIVTPSTLLATLRTVASIWDQEKQNRNVAEIARLAGRLYDKFVAFTLDLEKAEDRIRLAGESVGEARKKLATGKGNMINLAMKTKTLGGQSISKKEFDQSLIDLSKEDQIEQESSSQEKIENED
jgi:DNA recombination protein RmuC